jgi:hypothetical protein
MATPKLREGIDFYYEKGLFVLTEAYLRSRGYCCTNGCRHCPFGFANQQTHLPTHPSNSSDDSPLGNSSDKST